MTLSLLMLALANAGDVSLSLKPAVTWSAFAMSMFLPGLCDKGGIRGLFAGVAVALLVHSAIGLLQAFAFTRNEYPLLNLHTNPSFSHIPKIAETYARYVKRPCGLFPEPSAMAACIGPWALLLLGVAVGERNLGSAIGKSLRLLYAAGSIAGMLLIFASRSGFALALIPLTIALAITVSARKPSQMQAVVLAVLFSALGGLALRDRVDGEYLNSSWSTRSDSVAAALGAWFDSPTSNLIFGFGPGQSTKVMSSRFAYDAVWSVVITFVIENGIVGLLFGSLVGLSAAYSIVRSNARVVGIVTALGLGFGATLTTSYFVLVPIWLLLGVILRWDLISSDLGEAESLPSDSLIDDASAEMRGRGFNEAHSGH